MNLEDYKIICPLNYNFNTTLNSYKIKHSLSQETRLLHSLNYAEISNSIDKQRIIKDLKERRETRHPNLLEFIDYFEDKSVKILYLITETCPNGNLISIIDSCVKEKKYMSEELICHIIYQILCAMKTSKLFLDHLCLEDIFLDKDFNVKLLNFQLTTKKNYSELKEIKTNKLARIVYCLCTLDKYRKCEQDSKIKKVQFLYSTDFLSILNSLLKDGNSLHKKIDQILCNPLLLLKSSQWKKDVSFVIITNSLDEATGADYLQKFQNLNVKESELGIKEAKLKEREQILLHKEQQLTWMENNLRHKLETARIPNRKVPRKSFNLDKKKLDSSFSADCGDSIIITSQRMDGNFFNRDTFPRSKSNRKIRFKTHSPLKEVNFNRQKKVRQSCRSILTNSSHTQLEQENFHNQVVTKLECPSRQSSSNGSGKSKNSNNSNNQNDILEETRPISWNDESKKHAFELLRIMNKATMDTNQLKHTYL